MAMVGAVAAIMSASADTDVSGLTSETLGWMKVASTATNTIISVPWVEVGGDGTGVAVTNLVKTDSLSGECYLLYWDGSQFKGWSLNARNWVPGAVSYRNDKGGSATAQEAPAGYTLPRGKALFIHRPAGATNGDIYLYGKYVATAPAPFTIVAGTEANPTYTLIGNPSNAAVSLNEEGLFTDPGDDDQIMIPGADGSIAKICKRQDGQWKWWNDKKTSATVGTMTVYTPGWDDNVDIPIGRGVWYVSKGGTPTVQF